jgi:hypothetical protein
MPEGSGSATCPKAQGMQPARRGLQCRHVPHGTEQATCQERALVSPRASRHRARHPPGEGSGVCQMPRGTEPVTRQERASESPRASCLQARPLCRKALTSPHDRGTRTTARQGFGTATCPVAPDLPPGARGLQSRHVPSDSRPPGVPVRSQDT